MHGIDVSVPARRGRTPRATRSGSASARRRCSSPSRARSSTHRGNMHPRRRGHRRQLHRRQHPVPRPDAVGPGAAGLRAEHRAPPAVPRRRARSTCPGARSTPSSSTPTRTPRPASSSRTSVSIAHATSVDGDPGARRRRRHGSAADRLPAARARPCCGWSLFFVIPFYSAGRRPASTTRAARLQRLRDDLARRATTPTRCRTTGSQFVRSLGLRRDGDRRSACCSATRWRTRSRSRPGGGRT